MPLAIGEAVVLEKLAFVVKIRNEIVCQTRTPDSECSRFLHQIKVLAALSRPA
jgi:hypothetical protein